MNLCPKVYAFIIIGIDTHMASLLKIIGDFLANLQAGILPNLGYWSYVLLALFVAVEGPITTLLGAPAPITPGSLISGKILIGPIGSTRKDRTVLPNRATFAPTWWTGVNCLHASGHALKRLCSLEI